MVWSKLPASPSPSPSMSLSSCSSVVLDSSYSSSMGDLIGTESGVYMSSNEEEIWKPIERMRTFSSSSSSSSSASYSYNAVKKKKKKKEYPPPIPSLARTGNLPCRMPPWVFTRQYTHDGRLILRERRVQRHEYFHAHRENGRLILKLIPMDEQKQQQEDEIDDEDQVQELELEEDLDHHPLQFDEQDRGKEKIMVSSEEEEGIENNEDDVDEDHQDEDEDERKTVGKLITKFSTYASGMFMDSKLCFCNINAVNKVHQPPHTYLDLHHSTSSSSSFSSVPLRPMAAAL